MARTDTLSNYLTDVASAIKTKKGDSTPILASDFDTEITNLPSGGAELNTTLVKSDINDMASISYTTKGRYVNFPVYTIIKNIPAITLERVEGMQNLVSYKYFYACFCEAETIDLSTFNMSNSNLGNKDISYLFALDLKLEEIDFRNSINTDGITSFTRACSYCESLKKFIIHGASSPTTMGSMFDYCTSLEVIDIRNVDFSNLSSTGNGNILGSTGHQVPTTCLIVVSQSGKTYFNTNYSNYTNVKTPDELTAEDIALIG